MADTGGGGCINQSDVKREDHNHLQNSNWKLGFWKNK